jgi:4-amino-4-deoxy-L-arabinose transferase-like glycosyltransferase
VSVDVSLLESRFTLWFVSGLTIVLFALTNLPWQLDIHSQERQALASFQMVKEGRWFYQQAPRSRRVEREATKPPLVPWISAGLYGLTRSWDLAWRLPAFAAAIALAVLLFRGARDAFGVAAGLLALSAFSFNMLTPRIATLVRTDMPLALVVAAVGILIWNKVRTGAPWTAHDRLSIFALLTIGNYVKGPIVYVFLLPGIAAYELLRRKRGGATAWCGWWPWLGSLGIFLIWVIGGIVTQPAFYDQVVVHEFFGRFSATEHRPQPLYFYAGHLLRKLAPWPELLLIVASLAAWQSRGAVRERLQKMSVDTLWLCCWAFGGLLVMSFISSKRIDRIFPVIPPLCLLVAAQSHRGSQRTRRWAVAAFILSILLTLYYAGYSKIYLGYREHRDALSTFGRSVREEAAKNQWRYEAVTGHDGGMLLYLEKTQFVDLDRAIAAWNAHALDALVAETDEVPQLLAACKDAKLSGLSGTEKVDERGRTYVLIIRQE